MFLVKIVAKIVVNKDSCNRKIRYFINYKIVIVHVRYITMETKEVVRIGYNGFPFPSAFVMMHWCYSHRPSHEYACGKRNMLFPIPVAFLFQQYCILYILKLKNNSWQP
jgi:hypothetical protein